MARMTNEQLRQELERLRAEVETAHTDAETARAEAERARTEADEARTDADTARTAAARAEAEAARAAQAGEPDSATRGAASVRLKKKRGWGWTLLATVLVVIGALLAPVAVVSTWAQHELTDTAYFVNTFAPLAKKPAVQDLVVSETVSAIEANVDIEGITSDVFDGIDSLGLPPRASSALGTLQAPLVAGIKSLITSSVTKFVQSDAFSQIWTQALTTTHQQLLATLRGDKNAVVTVGANGKIGLQLGPIIQTIKERLVDQGFTFATSIPKIDKTIVIAQSSSVTLYIGLYNLVVAVGIWLPWVALVFLAAGVVVARRRVIALIWASAALTLTMVLVAMGIDIGKTIFQVSVSDVIPADAAGVIYAGILGFVQSIAVVIAVLAFTVLVVTVFSGPFRWARALRRYAGNGFAVARAGAERYGITTGRTGEWIHRQRVLLRVLVALASAAIVLFVRPLTVPLIVWTAVVALVVVALLELLGRPPVSDPVPAADRRADPQPD